MFEGLNFRNAVQNTSSSSSSSSNSLEQGSTF